MESYHIELAEADQIACLQAIELAAAQRFPEPLLPASVREQVSSRQELMDARRRGQLWVAAGAGRQPVGFAMASVADDMAFLMEVDVHPDHQGRGLGRALVNTVVGWASGLALSGVVLTTFQNVPWNAPFYEKLGFRMLTENEMPEWLRQKLEEERTLGLKERVAMKLSC
ncbi:GNAT family N-acetyltransferase [Natronospirillum operosum]|nr:GNAT family N-acetyltransferase [Natronospirillum operosum]